MKKLTISILFSAFMLQGCASSGDGFLGWFSEEIDPKEQQLEEEKQRQDLMEKSAMAEMEVDPNTTMRMEGETTVIEQTSGEVADNKDDEAPMTKETSPQDKPQIAPPMTGGQRINFSERFKQPSIALVQASKKKQIQNSVENNYQVFRELNHQFIKSNTAPNQYKELNRTVDHFVMDLIANMTPDLYMAPLVVRPMKLKVADVANPDGGKELVTSLIAAQMQDYGFMVFDGRKPRGKFTGEELILETSIESYGEQFVLYGTLRQLSSNKVAGTHQAFISDYFFRNIQDGVEVYLDEPEF